MGEDQHNKEQQHQNRLEKKRERTRSSRMNETEEQRQKRLEKEKDRSRSIRMNETEEQRQKRLEQQKKRSKSNRAKKKAQKRAIGIIGLQQQNNELQMVETEELESCDSVDLDHSIQNEISSRREKNAVYPSWPQPISRALKEACLQKFLNQSSMSELAEVTCAVCNVRTPIQQSKKVPFSEIPNIHLLKVSDEFKNLIRNIQSSNTEQSNQEIVTAAKNNTTPITGHSQSNRFSCVIYEYFGAL